MTIEGRYIILNEKYPNDNYKSNIVFYTGFLPTETEVRSLINFDLSSLENVQINKAELVINNVPLVETEEYGNQGVNLHKVIQSWSFETATWNNQPSYDSDVVASNDVEYDENIYQASPYDSVIIPSPYDSIPLNEYSFDITSIIYYLIQHNAGVLLKAENENEVNLKRFDKAYLDIWYTEGPYNPPESYCGDSTCDPDENAINCPQDCSEEPNEPYCGDGNIDPGEECDDGSQNSVLCTPPYDDSCTYCSESCTEITINGPYCGDNNCDSEETPTSCPEDCPEDPPGCGDGVCDYDENAINCPEDCLTETTECGDHKCEGDENAINCPKDCQLEPGECGDGTINTGENCDDGAQQNGVLCTPPYDGSCVYCSESCTKKTINGPYCGNGECDKPYEDSKNCVQDCPPTECELKGGTCRFDIDGCSQNEVEKEYGCPQYAKCCISYDLNKISLVSPLHGVSNESTFDIIIKTEYDSECKFLVTLDERNVPSYGDMYNFDSTGGKEHIISDYKISSFIPYTLYVKCKYGILEPDESKPGKFSLSVDGTAPLILEFYADGGSQIFEKPVEKNLIVRTDDESICAIYNKSEDYETAKLFLDLSFLILDNSFFKKINQFSKFFSDETKDYKFYALCKNKAGFFSEPAGPVIVSVNLDADVNINAEPLQRYTKEPNAQLNVTTNKDAFCIYWSEKEEIENAKEFTNTGGVIHRQSILFQKENKYSYNIKCYASDAGPGSASESAIQTVTFYFDGTPPSKPYVDDSSTLNESEFTYWTDRLDVRWISEDNLSDSEWNSGIDYFYYKLQDSSNKTVINWTKSRDNNEWITVDEDHNGDELNLTDGEKYFFTVKAYDMVGLESEQGISDGITVNISKMPAGCIDGKWGANETDVDCGGECPPCKNGYNCLFDYDCISNFCDEGICQEPTCYDNIKNGDETDVDCGGVICLACGLNKMCEDDYDCISGECLQGICIGINYCENNKLDSVTGETDTDCGGECPSCDNGKKCKKDSDCKSGNCDGGYCNFLEKDTDGDGVPDNKDNCPNDYNPDQKDLDNDDKGDVCDSDKDGDGMRDSWERGYGLSTDFNDGSEDKDGDGLTNLEEYKYQTDPTKKDTDGDGYSDYDEVKIHKTSPTDPDEKPKSRLLPWFLLILGIILVAAGVLYLFVYKPQKKPKKTKPFKSGFTPPLPLKPRESLIDLRKKQAVANIRIKNDRQRLKDHDKIFSTFKPKQQTKVNNNLNRKIEIVKTELIKEPEKNKSSIGKTAEKKKPKIEGDVFKELARVASEELKKRKKFKQTKIK